MEKIQLKTRTRTAKGNGPARVLRREGRLPAVLYGPHAAPRMLSIDLHDLDLVLRKGNIGRMVLDLIIDDSAEARPVMVKELQRHPVSRTFLHMDLYEISMDRKIWVNVPVVVTGKSKGVEMGGMLQIIRRELEVVCLPNEIPDAITIDVSDLELGHSLHVEDIKLSGNLEIPHDVNFTVLTVISPQADAAKSGEADEGAAEAGETQSAGQA